MSKGDLTLETLLEEKRAYDLSSQFEKLGVDEGEIGWAKPGMRFSQPHVLTISLETGLECYVPLADFCEAPSVAQAIQSLPTRSNILSVSAGNSRLMVTTADRQLHLLDADNEFAATSLIALHESPILACADLRQEYLLTASMSGQLILSDFNGRVSENRRDHTKYIVKIAIYGEDELVATAGWDNKISIYAPSSSTADSKPRLGEPVATISLLSKPEAMLFTSHPENGNPILILSRTDSSFLHYYTVEPTPRLLGRQNLAPHSNAWVAFTPSAFALSPTEPSLLAVALSTVPHMKLAIVRLLIPPYSAAPDAEAETSALPPTLRTSLLDDRPASETQASQAPRRSHPG